jgi:uncharacterized protein (DUF433 family)
VPGKVAGKPLIKGTRILADAIIEDGLLDEVHNGFPSLSVDTIRKLLAFAPGKQLFS